LVLRHIESAWNHGDWSALQELTTLEFRYYFGRRPHGPVGECLADGAGMSNEVADRTLDAPPPPTQSAVAVGRDVPLDGRAAQAGDL
jgi:hypothetical protein